MAENEKRCPTKMQSFLAVPCGLVTVFAFTKSVTKSRVYCKRKKQQVYLLLGI